MSADGHAKNRKFPARHHWAMIVIGLLVAAAVLIMFQRNAQSFFRQTGNSVDPKPDPSTISDPKELD